MKACYALLLLASCLLGHAAANDAGAVNNLDITTNVCNMNWYYCPRDPGCITYKMSAKEVLVHADNFAKPVDAERLSPGDIITIEVKGVTSLTSIPAAGSFRIYDLAGHNEYAGVLSDVMTLVGNDFTLNITFRLDAGTFAPGNWVEWGLDVFQDPSGSNEAMCIEFADNEYLQYEKSIPSPPFVDYCVDNGDGTFRNHTIKIQGTPIAAPACNKGCDLNWYYCPRDPGCVTYTMSTDTVEVDVNDKSGIRSNDTATLLVHGTTSLRSVPIAGSYRIYALSGGNAGTGVLTDVMTLSACGTKGCNFALKIPVPITMAMFTTQGWFEFGLDVFQAKSGSDEGMCIEVANDLYVKYEETPPQLKEFYTICKDEGWGHFVKDQIPEVVSKAVCKLL